VLFVLPFKLTMNKSHMELDKANVLVISYVLLFLKKNFVG
jgi:hypothetical protein